MPRNTSFRPASFYSHTVYIQCEDRGTKAAFAELLLNLTDRAACRVKVGDANSESIVGILKYKYLSITPFKLSFL